jgi:hypothetical protein
MNVILLGGLSGAGAGCVLLFLSHIAPRWSAQRTVRDIDEPRFFGRAVPRREAHLFGMVLHLALSFVFGAVFAWAVMEGIFSGFTAAPLCVYAALITCVMGGIVAPLEGHGVFGVKEDTWYPVDLVITNMLWVVLYGVVMGMVL